MKLHALRVRGDARNYDVDLGGRQDAGLAIIAGGVSTGKTSVLQLVDYCLGAGSYPRYPEIAARGRAALLELELGGSTIVIERELGASNHVVVHRATLDGMAEPHERYRRRLGAAGEADSLSWLLLEPLGLAGVSLREAPTRPDSPRQPLSFRDLQRLYFLSHQRLDNGDLLDEANFMRALKLRQVIDLVFGIQDERASELGAQLQAVREERRALERETASLERFLDEHGVPRPDPAEIREAEAEARAAEARLAQLDASITATMGHLTWLRDAHEAAVGRCARRRRCFETGRRSWRACSRSAPSTPTTWRS